MSTVTLAELMVEYDRALRYTDDLWSDLTPDEIGWRPHEQSSAIGWHLGHQPAVAHFMIRNLTAAEPRLDPELELLMDSATDERQRGELPPPERLADFRAEVADRVRFRVDTIDGGRTGAPTQLRVIARNLMIAVINHEYQHDRWIGEVRAGQHGRALPPEPTSAHLATLDGYVVVNA